MGDINDFKKDMDKLLKAFKNKALMDKIGKFTVDLIRKRTLLGYGVADQGGKKEKLKALSAGYKKWRKKNPPPGPSSPAKSNLTYTGDMLRAIDYNVKSDSLTIGIFDENEAEKAFYNMLMDREFLNLSGAEIQQVRDYIQKILDDEIDKL